jgi:hypothetical protein
MTDTDAANAAVKQKGKEWLGRVNVKDRVVSAWQYIVFILLDYRGQR